jgi:predicted permease
MVEIDPQGGGYAREQLPQLYRSLIERVEAIPGVSSASLSYYGLFSGGRRNNVVTIDSYSPQSDDDLRIQDSFVTPRYFETVGVPIVAGRGFEPEDRKGSPRVAVVNETFARHFFGVESPVGKRFGVDGEGSGRDIEIVGVAKDIIYDDHREETPRFAYYPVFQDSTYLHSLEVRTDIDPAGVIPLVRRAVADEASELPVLEVRTLADQIERSLRGDKRVSQLTSFFGLLALVLACIGLYGVMAFGVVQRTNEIGIRTALGANPVQVLWMVLKDGLLLVGVGILVGIPAALAATRLASSLLFGLGVMDPLAMFGAIAFLLLVAIVAGLLPARRASSLSPTSALRYE